MRIRFMQQSPSEGASHPRREGSPPCLAPAVPCSPSLPPPPPSGIASRRLPRRAAPTATPPEGHPMACCSPPTTLSASLTAAHSEAQQSRIPRIRLAGSRLRLGPGPAQCTTAPLRRRRAGVTGHSQSSVCLSESESGEISAGNMNCRGFAGPSPAYPSHSPVRHRRAR